MVKAKETVSTRKAAPPKPGPAQKQKCTPEQRFRMIQEAAYFRAEKAGFLGNGAEFWLAAEKDIDKKLSRG